MDKDKMMAETWFIKHLKDEIKSIAFTNNMYPNGSL